MTPPSKLTCNNGQANLGGSSDEYVETLSNEPEHCRLYLFSENRKCIPVYGGPLSPAGLGRENGFWKFDRFHQQVWINVWQQGSNFECCWSQKIVRFVKNNSNKDMISPEQKYMPPEIYLWVDDHEEEKRENAVDDHVRVSQVNLDLGRSKHFRIYIYLFWNIFFLFLVIKKMH